MWNTCGRYLFSQITKDKKFSIQITKDFVDFVKFADSVGILKLFHRIFIKKGC